MFLVLNLTCKDCQLQNVSFSPNGGPSLFNSDLEQENGSNSDISVSLRPSIYQGDPNGIRIHLHFIFPCKAHHSTWSYWFGQTTWPSKLCDPPTFPSSILCLQVQDTTLGFLLGSCHSSSGSRGCITGTLLTEKPSQFL